MNRDALHEKLSHAAVVLDAGIYAEGLAVNQLRTLMHVALNLIEDAQSEARSPTCHRNEVQP